MKNLKCHTVRKLWFPALLVVVLLAVCCCGCFEGGEGGDAGSDSATAGEKNALRSAKTYLAVQAFSYNGLVAQLKFEGFTEEQASHGVDNCGADWMEQAKKSAAQYLKLMAYSKDALIAQLEFDGFTHEQAVYGAEVNGL